ncbi:uncharacterized protein LOC143257155 isoform X1 [Tachypleus tridentatus]|uniref:uncharacterized protein LOC143257155 isoform X1 n=1 Tax=Tachypleus tridentatus TaxID=6853 RepID=UPI003FD688E4
MAEGGSSDVWKYKVIFSSKAVEGFEEIKELMQCLPSCFEMFVTSHERRKLSLLEKDIGLGAIYRRNLKEVIGQWREEFNNTVVVIVGAVDEDMYIAVHQKTLLLAAQWCDPNDNVCKYGIPVPSPTKLKVILQIIANQSKWFYSVKYMDGDTEVKVYSLLSVNTWDKYVQSKEEQAFLTKITKVLKGETRNATLKQALMCHLLAAIQHTPEFREVQDWAVAPSSKEAPSDVLLDLKEHLRYMMYGRLPKNMSPSDNMFVRSHSVQPSKCLSAEERNNYHLIERDFQSISINACYNKKLSKRVICVLDDMTTYGNTFEALRNILATCNPKKIIFLAIGKFRKFGVQYRMLNYTIQGDVFTQEYTAVFNSAEIAEEKYEWNAQRDVCELASLAQELTN